MELSLSYIQVSQIFSWKVLVPVVTIYCGVYVYEKITWTETSQEKALRSQVGSKKDGGGAKLVVQRQRLIHLCFHRFFLCVQLVSHIENKFQLQVSAIRTSYIASLERSLRKLLGSLGHALHDAQIKQDLKIKQSQQEASVLTRLKSQAHDLR